MGANANPSRPYMPALACVRTPRLTSNVYIPFPFNYSVTRIPYHLPTHTPHTPSSPSQPGRRTPAGGSHITYTSHSPLPLTKNMYTTPSPIYEMRTETSPPTCYHTPILGSRFSERRGTGNGLERGGNPQNWVSPNLRFTLSSFLHDFFLLLPRTKSHPPSPSHEDHTTTPTPTRHPAGQIEEGRPPPTRWVSSGTWIEAAQGMNHQRWVGLVDSRLADVV